MGRGGAGRADSGRRALVGGRADCGRDGMSRVTGLAESAGCEWARLVSRPSVACSEERGEWRIEPLPIVDDAQRGAERVGGAAT